MWYPIPRVDTVSVTCKCRGCKAKKPFRMKLGMLPALKRLVGDQGLQTASWGSGPGPGSAGD